MREPQLQFQRDLHVCMRCENYSDDRVNTQGNVSWSGDAYLCSTAFIEKMVTSASTRVQLHLLVEKRSRPQSERSPTCELRVLQEHAGAPFTYLLILKDGFSGYLDLMPPQRLRYQGTSDMIFEV
jgi:hypothetical protein